MPEKVTSKDGTEIAYTRAGAGPPLILVDGALCDRAMGPNTKLASHLSSRFTVFTYDRRGRGESGDRAPYGVEREIEDLDAVIEAAGGSADVYGISSGGALALEAATRLSSISRLALYELPYVVDDSRRPIPSNWAGHLAEMAATDQRADAVRYFLRDCVGVPRVVVGLMRFMPVWPKLKAVAHTLPYDARIVGDLGRGAPLPAEPVVGRDGAGARRRRRQEPDLDEERDARARRRAAKCAISDARRSDTRGQARPAGAGADRVLHALRPPAGTSGARLACK